MRKCLPLNILAPTKTKERLLSETYIAFFSIINEAFGHLGEAKSRAELHEKTYNLFRGKYGVASQLIIEATRYAWSVRKTINGKITKCVVRFDKRLFNLKRTKRGNPALSIRLNNKRVGLPIRLDGAYQRLQAHLKDGWKVTSIIMTKDRKFLAVLSKEFPEPQLRPNWMGIDVNSSKIAVSVISKDKVLKQTYFGKDIFVKQSQFEKRRAMLQSYRDKGSSKAGLKLKALSGKQKNYVRTRMWQIVNEVINLAKSLNANIAMERLKHLMKRKGEWNKESRKKINRIPYGFFRHALKYVAEREGIIIKEIKPNYTSQTCPRCGYIGKENWKNYVYFKCVRCGYEADRDRVASLNISLRAALEGVSQCQFPEADAQVSGHVLKDEGCERWYQTTPSFKPADLSVGS